MSALLSEADLNDFISPSLACTKPTEIRVEEQQPSENDEISVGKEPMEMQKVSISLQDCLACVGCITSSEEILLTRQSHTVFLENWDKNNDEGRGLAVSLSPQTRVSLAAYYDITVEQFDYAFANLFKRHFDARYIVGTQMGRVATINHTNQMLWDMKQDNTLNGKPMLSAVCPGFVLYCEKTKPDLVKYLLNVKSPQQITGSLLKDLKDEKLYHLSIMPCFDKKLEASRKDGEYEVDCVITPKEFVVMLDELNLKFEDFLIPRIETSPLLQDMTPPGWDLKTHWAVNEGSSSGGFAFQYILATQQKYPGSSIEFNQGRNLDICEYKLMKEGQMIANSCEVYGFRNIQNLVRKMLGDNKKRGINIIKRRGANANRDTTTPSRVQNIEPHKSDFVEVMACPSGCINGGGLLSEGSVAEKKALVQKLNEKYKKEISILPVIEGEDTNSKEYKYEFNPIFQQPEKDLVTVGNTW